MLMRIHTKTTIQLRWDAIRLSTGRAGGPWPEGGPGPDLKGQGPVRNLAGPALFGRSEGQLMCKLALGSGPGRTRTDPFW